MATSQQPRRSGRSSQQILAGLGTLLALGTTPLAASAAPGDWIYDYDRAAGGGVAPAPVPLRRSPYRLQAPPPVPGRTAYGPGFGGGYPAPVYPGAPERYAYGTPVDPALLEAQMAQRCNIGRLVGGLVGGGVGYAASRQDGRSWAVPLGALLGQQMGCSIGAGRTPLPW